MCFYEGISAASVLVGRVLLPVHGEQGAQEKARLVHRTMERVQTKRSRLDDQEREWEGTPQPSHGTNCRFDVVFVRVQGGSLFIPDTNIKKKKKQARLAGIQRTVSTKLLPKQSTHAPEAVSSILDISALEAAKQICIIEHQLFESISLSEFITRSRDKTAEVPKLSALIRNTNKVRQNLPMCYLLVSVHSFILVVNENVAVDVTLYLSSSSFLYLCR